MKLDDTLFVLVTCCREQSRFDVLEQVVTDLNKHEIFVNAKKNDFIVFDNASTIHRTDELLTTNFDHVLKASHNQGFWFAMHWLLQNYRSVLNKEYKYIYTIESDFIHYDTWKLLVAKQFLDENLDVGCVRAEEFEYVNRHLYNKDVPHTLSRKYAWSRMWNAITNSSINFKKYNDVIYTTNFVPKVPGLNRIEIMKNVLIELSEMKSFSEFDFQKCFYKYSQLCGIIDGGVFHCKLTNDQRIAISSSYTTKEEQEKFGYVGNRTECTIPNLTNVSVQSIK